MLTNCGYFLIGTSDTNLNAAVTLLLAAHPYNFLFDKEIDFKLIRSYSEERLAANDIIILQNFDINNIQKYYNCINLTYLPIKYLDIKNKIKALSPAMYFTGIYASTVFVKTLTFNVQIEIIDVELIPTVPTSFTATPNPVTSRQVFILAAISAQITLPSFLFTFKVYDAAEAGNFLFNLNEYGTYTVASGITATTNYYVSLKNNITGIESATRLLLTVVKS